MPTTASGDGTESDRLAAGQTMPQVGRSDFGSAFDAGAARRASWIDKTAGLLLPDMPYFQVVFTIPDVLSSLILGNRRELYNLLFRSAWGSLNQSLRQENGQ